jgi:hypothetical protein
LKLALLIVITGVDSLSALPAQPAEPHLFLLVGSGLLVLGLIARRNKRNPR